MRIIEMVDLPAGKFLMGSPPEELGRFDDEKQREVSVGAFSIAKTPVTQSQWEAVMGKNPSHFKGRNRPVEMVSFDDCVEFCKELTKLHRGNGTIGPGDRYRLPTEEEWEYACRAGSTGPIYGDLDEIAWYGGNSGGETHPVAQKRPNAWGLYDMIGNVWEWTGGVYGR